MTIFNQFCGCDVADKRLACLFNSSGHCGYYNDLIESLDLFFLWDEVSECMTASSSIPRPYRQLMESEISTSMLSNRGKPVVPSENPHESSVGMTFPGDNITVSKHEDVVLFLRDMIEAVFDFKSKIPNAIIWSIDISWADGSPWLDASMAGSSSMSQNINGRTHVVWRLFGISPIVRVRTKPEYVGKAELIIRLRVKSDTGFISFQKQVETTLYEPMPIITLVNGLLPVDVDATFIINQSVHAGYTIGLVVFGNVEENLLVIGINETSATLTKCDLDYCEYILSGCNTLEMDCVVAISPNKSRSNVKIMFFAVSAITTEGSALSVENSLSEKTFEVFWIPDVVSSYHINEARSAGATINLHQLIQNFAWMVEKTPLELQLLKLYWDESIFEFVRLSGKTLAVEIDIHTGQCMVSIDPENFDSLLELDTILANSWVLQVIFNFRNPHFPLHEYTLASEVTGLRAHAIDDVVAEGRTNNVEIQQRRLNGHADRKLESIDLSTSFKLWPITLHTLFRRPLNIHFPTLFEDVTGYSSETTIAVFDKRQSLQSVKSRSFGVVNIEQTQRHLVTHDYDDQLEFERTETVVYDVLFLLDINVMDDENVITYRIHLPIIWKILPEPTSFSMETFSIGSTEISIGAPMRLKAEADGIVVNSARLEILLSDCIHSVLNLVTMGGIHNISSTDKTCVFSVRLSSVENSTKFPLEVIIFRQSDRFGKIGVQVTLAHEMAGGDSMRQSSRSVLSYVEFHVCQTAFGEAYDFYVLETENHVYNTFELISRVFPSRQLNDYILTNLLIVWSISDNLLIGNFSVNGSLLSPVPYNDTAMFISVEIFRFNSFLYQSKESENMSGLKLDAIVKWKDQSKHEGCTLRSNLRLFTLPRSARPATVAPYSFSRKLYQGLSLNISLLSTEVANAMRELIEVNMHLNSSGLALSVNNSISPATMSKAPTYEIVSRETSISKLYDTSIVISPEDKDFVGVVDIDFAVCSYVVNRGVSLFQDFQTSVTTMYRFPVEWILMKFTSISVPSSGLAIYRSLPMPIRSNNATFTFEYRLSSGNCCVV